MNFKEIHIGKIIETNVAESGIEISRICNFIKCTELEVSEMYRAKSIDAHILLRWSKLLEYDFFRPYSQHLILYAPTSSVDKSEKKKPTLRKNIYTKEIIDFILNQIKNKQRTKLEIIKEYKIPKTTLYKWLRKYKNEVL
ncbi:transposase [Chryseobacterium sp. SIMBA_038]|uniref:transposase n=1 Tax=Chryseobacterium sp. SIMBA_038 TaxID=3085780 RepID=UPI00397C0998